MSSLGIYIQVPFCASKCSFCNFSSRVVPASAFDHYGHALETEIDRLAAFYAEQGIGLEVMGLEVDSVYVGGGTPSLLGARRLGELVQALHRRFRFRDSPEFTLEMTPGSAGLEFLASARRMGVNRLSIGAQSFDDLELHSVGRLHDAATTRELVGEARRAGFENINLDLIAGLPHQTHDSWLRSLGAAAALAPEHLSVYLFEIDEKSRLGRELIGGGNRYHARAVPDEDFMADAYETARQFLKREGYAQYEISNFARPGYASRHNRKYWRLEPYVGLGAGAHSFDGERRWLNVEDVETYQTRLAEGLSPLAEVRTLSSKEQLEEFLIVGLREREGIDLATAARRWGQRNLARSETVISSFVQQGWLEQVGGRVRLAERAMLVSNEIFQELVT